MKKSLITAILIPAYCFGMEPTFAPWRILSTEKVIDLFELITNR